MFSAFQEALLQKLLIIQSECCYSFKIFFFKLKSVYPLVLWENKIKIILSTIWSSML